MKYYMILGIITCSFLFVQCNESSSQELQPKEQEAQDLSEDLAKIVSLIDSEQCTNVEDWKYSPIGSKACGGPKFYIAYSTKSDTTNILRLIDEYTAAEKKYNIEYSIVSDCAVVLPPTSITCKDNKATLIYE